MTTATLPIPIRLLSDADLAVEVRRLRSEYQRSLIDCRRANDDLGRAWSETGTRYAMAAVERIEANCVSRFEAYIAVKHEAKRRGLEVHGG